MNQDGEAYVLVQDRTRVGSGPRLQAVHDFN